MVSNELNNIVERLKSQGQMTFLDSATDQQIIDFEKSHGLKLPLKYKEWLLFSDGGECFLPAGVQFYGIAHKPTIDADDDNRPNDSYIVIGALSSGDPILYKKNKEEIAIFNREAGIIEDDEIYDDFFAFLNNLFDLLGIGE